MSPIKTVKFDSAEQAAEVESMLLQNFMNATFLRSGPAIDVCLSGDDEMLRYIVAFAEGYALCLRHKKVVQTLEQKTQIISDAIVHNRPIYFENGMKVFPYQFCVAGNRVLFTCKESPTPWVLDNIKEIHTTPPKT